MARRGRLVGGEADCGENAEVTFVKTTNLLPGGSVQAEERKVEGQMKKSDAGGLPALDGCCGVSLVLKLLVASFSYLSLYRSLSLANLETSCLSCST